MAVKIPIITVFDSKGLRQAQFQLNKVSGNIANLSRNFAIAGAAFAGIAVGLGKSVKVASDLGESVNALNVAFGSSAAGIIAFGKTSATTLGVASVDFNNAAVRFSAFADRIVGAGNNASGFIAEISTRASDFASVFNIDVAEALQVFQSGLAGEAEPLKRFGINLLDSEVKAFAMANGIGEVGRQLTETEKVQARYGLLMEATAKTQGDFANTSGGLANGMRILEAQITDTQAEIGMALLPVLEDLLPVVSDLVAEFGDKLKVAVANVDWASFITSIVETISYFVENIETITRLATTLFLLNTAFNATKAAVGLFNVASVILGNTFVVTAGKIGLATGAVKLFRTALITTGIGALVVGLGFIIEAIINTNNASKDGTPTVTNYGGALRKSGADAEWAASKYGVAAGAARDLASATRGIATNADRSSFGPTVTGTSPQASFIPTIPTPSAINSGKKAAKKTVSVVKALKKDLETEQKKQAAFVRLTEKKGLSEGLATQILGGSKPLKTAAKIVQGTKKAAKDLQKIFNTTAAGQQEASNRLAEETAQAAEDLRKFQQAQAEAERQGAEALAEFNRQEQERAREEQAILEERERVYKSFADSVSSTFSKIKDDILGAFSLPQMGGSTDAIIRNMDKLLTRVKAFSGNITRLSSMGLDPKLLQQVINAGPIAGAKLAANLVAGGVGGLSAINRGYAELGNVAGEIGMTGTQALFGTQAQQVVYNVNINGGLDSGASIGKAVVDAVKAYERASGPVWQGA
jgi:hypothetical protein